MMFYVFFLSFIILLCGRYNLKQGSCNCNKNKGYQISILFIIFVSAMRFNIGYDWSNYLAFVYPVFDPRNIKRLEPFNKLIIMFAGHLNQPWILFSFYAVVTYSLYGKTIYDFSNDKFESLMIYICLFFLAGLSTIRQEIAVAIVFYGYKFIKEKKIIKYVAVCIVAMCFHKTAIVALFIYPLYYLKFSVTIIMIFFFSLIFKFLLPFIVEELFPYYTFYFSNFKTSSGNLQRIFYLILLFYVLLLHNNSRVFVGMTNICAFGCILPFVLGGHSGGRLAEYFLIYFIFLIPISNKKLKIQNRIFVLFPFYVYFFLYLIISVVKNKSNDYIPFKWYFLESLNQHL